ncbi:MAG: alanine racemase, partial [Muribaculaceae bacterium]|nr:alanine racemase [Muribaculaceae bacterium]
PGLIERGVTRFVVERDWNEAPRVPGIEFWRVDSVLAALQDVAAGIREMFPALPVIGITGSRGKTVTKELLNMLLRERLSIVRSPRSYNSQIGVPLSVWGLTPDADLAIFEAGISEPGEMERLRRVIRPTIGVFTSLTDEHGEGFTSLREKAREKALLFEGCGPVFYPAGEELIADALREVDCRPCPVEGELALAVASHIDQSVTANFDIPAYARRISARIDVCETLKDCLIVYDGFPTDLQSVTAAVNYAMRHAAGRKVTLVLGGKDDIDDPQLHRLLEAKGITRVIKAATPTDFIDHYSISDFNHEVILVCGPAAEGFDDVKTHLEAPRHETIMEVDLGAIAGNFNYYRSLLPPSTGLIAMVKAAGYGTGALELSKTLQNQGAAYLAVAVIDEGAELRRGGITMPIIVMNPITTNYKALFDNRLEPSVFSLRELELLLDAARRHGVRDYPVHIKLDTGMHRLGFLRQELPALLSILNSQDCVKVSTIFSHLATADCLDQDAYTASQLEDFEQMSSEIMAGLPYPVKRHVLNSAGIMRYPAYHYDFARLGIGLYGISPIGTGQERLQTVAQLFTTIISIKQWAPGITIGYGRRGVITRPSVIATIPIGYADGLDRHLSNGAASFIVNGIECPIVGNICMDQCMIDVTDANAQIGDKVEIFGKTAPLQRLSDTLATIPYEILTSISPRVKRIYFRE